MKVLTVQSRYHLPSASFRGSPLARSLTRHSLLGEHELRTMLPSNKTKYELHFVVTALKRWCPKGKSQGNPCCCQSSAECGGKQCKPQLIYHASELHQQVPKTSAIFCTPPLACQCYTLTSYGKNTWH